MQAVEGLACGVVDCFLDFAQVFADGINHRCAVTACSQEFVGACGLGGEDCVFHREVAFTFNFYIYDGPVRTFDFGILHRGQDYTCRPVVIERVKLMADGAFAYGNVPD